jgi:hypothetical protein
MYTANLKIHGIVRLAVARPVFWNFFDFNCITRTLCITRTVFFSRLLNIFV